MTDQSAEQASEKKPDEKSNSPVGPFYTQFSQTSSLALLSTLFYMICYVYYLSFSKRLALPYQGIDLPLTLIIGDIAFIISIFLVSLIILKVIIRYHTRIKEFARYFVFTFNIITYILTLLLVEQTTYEIDDASLLNFLSKNSGFSLLIVSLGIIFLLLIVSLGTVEKTLKKIENLKQVNYKDWLINIINKITTFNTYSFIGLILIILIAADFAGHYNAEQLIEGKKGNVEIKLLPEENISLPNSPLILLMIRDNNYYVVEMNDTAPENVSVLIIPSNKIKFARTMHA